VISPRASARQTRAGRCLATAGAPQLHSPAPPQQTRRQARRPADNTPFEYKLLNLSTWFRFITADRTRDRGAVLHLRLHHLMSGDTVAVTSPTDWRQTDLAKRVLRRVEASAQAAARMSDAIKRRLGRAEAGSRVGQEPARLRSGAPAAYNGVPYLCVAPLPLNSVDPAALAAQVFERNVGIRRTVRHLLPSSSALVCAGQEVCASCLWPGLLPMLARARACKDCVARAAQARCAARQVGVGQTKSARLLAKLPPLPAAHTSDGSGGVSSGRGRAASTALAAAEAPAAVAAAGGANAAGMLGAARPAPMMPHGAFLQPDIGGATSRRRQRWGGGSRQENRRTRRGRRWRVSARSHWQRGRA